MLDMKMRTSDIDVALTNESFLKRVSGDYIIYNRKWLLEHLDEEYESLKIVRDSKPIKPFSLEDFKNWMEQQKILGDEYDVCWQQGYYAPDLDCRLCQYSLECSGADFKEDE